MVKKIRKKFNNYLLKLAEANEESFGGQKLECCNLKEYQKPKKTAKDNDGGIYAKK